MTLCNRCGDCCENIYTRLKPEDLELPDERFNETNLQTVEFMRKYWEPTVPDGSGYRWECAKFNKETRLCEAHDERPPICSGYPYYGVKDRNLQQSDLPNRCSYNADIRTNLPIVAITESGVDRSAGSW